MEPRGSAYEYHIQVLECPRCGAPVTAPIAGGQQACAYCGSVLAVGVRRTAGVHTGRPTAGSPERLAWLRAQFARTDRPCPLEQDETLAQDLQQVWLARPSRTPDEWREEVLPPVQELWRKAVARCREAPEDETARYRVFTLARALSWLYGLFASLAQLAGRPIEDASLRNRSTLETTLSLVGDSVFGYATRCNLVNAAARAGDLASARAWLSTLDPEPEEPDLDTHYRAAVARLAVEEKDPETILTVLGPDLDTIPVRPGAEPVLAAYRIHAYEMRGDLAAARRALAAAEQRLSAQDMRSALLRTNLAPLTLPRTP
jgi:DNA-directed RNA polymerase subunit RPC12/RpoP